MWLFYLGNRIAKQNNLWPCARQSFRVRGDVVGSHDPSSVVSTRPGRSKHKRDYIYTFNYHTFLLIHKALFINQIIAFVCYRFFFTTSTIFNSQSNSRKAFSPDEVNTSDRCTKIRKKWELLLKCSVADMLLGQNYCHIFVVCHQYQRTTKRFMAQSMVR